MKKVLLGGYLAALDKMRKKSMNKTNNGIYG